MRRRLLLGGLTLSAGGAALGRATAPVGDGGSGRKVTPESTSAPGRLVTDFGARPDGVSDTSAPIGAAFAAYSRTRTSPPGLENWGVGAIATPRGSWRHTSPIRFVASQVGFTLRGEANYATAHLFDISSGAALPLKTYVATMLSDFYLRNTAGDPGESVGIDLDPHGGGGLLSVKRISIDGFRTGIRVGGTENGDKTLVEQVAFGTAIGFDNGRNKQAIGWTFLNCAGACARTHYRLGGAGEVAIINHVGDVYGSLIELPEGSGNPGSGHYPGARITVQSTKLEYHGDGPRMLLDAGRSVRLTDQGGSNCDLVFREVALASGTTAPDPRRHVVIQVGDERGGSDAVRLKQEGGWIEGVVRLGGSQLGALNRRWSFRDAMRAPDPATVELLGPGSHPLLEWRGNENVPVDQYRGGEAFTGAIDAQKAFLWRHVGPALLNTGVRADALDGRFGGAFGIGGFPVGAAQTALAVYLDHPVPPGHDLEIRQFTDGSFREAVGPALRLPAGAGKGLHRVHDLWRNMADGSVHLRITAPSPRLLIRGAVVIFYFPYMGT